MSETTQRRHGVESFFASAESSAEAAVDISVLSGFRFLNVRLDPCREQVVEAATQILGQPMPLDSNTFTTGEHRVYWLGPDEWLIVTSGEGADGLADELAEGLAGFHAAINDVSGANVALRVSGVDARTVLAKGCTLDLHPRAFGPGRCARTGLAKSIVLLGVLDNASSYTIIVPRSFSDYLCRWFAHAARPHGVRFSMV